MAKKRKNRKGVEPAALKRHRLSKQGSKKVAKKRRKRSSRRRSSRSRAIVVRRHGPPARRRRGRSRRSHGGGGGVMSIIPGGQELKELAATAVYGFLESKAKADPTFLLNKTPMLIPQLGYAGNVALVLRAANKLFVRNSWLGLLANGAAHAAMYQMGRRGGLATDTNVFTIAGDYDDYAEISGDDYADIAGEGAHMDGVPFDNTMPGT